MNTSPETANGPALMAAAAAEAARVVAGAKRTALDQPTPCTDWDVRTLLTHMILWTAYSAERRAYGESVAEELMSKDFTAEPGYAQAYQAQIAKAMDAWSKPEAWEGDRNVMGSAPPPPDIPPILIPQMLRPASDISKPTD